MRNPRCLGLYIISLGIVVAGMKEDFSLISHPLSWVTDKVSKSWC